MTPKPPLKPGLSYHVYTRGNNRSPLFLDDEDFLHFIYLMEIFLTPVADVYSYALMLNHLHLAIRIKTDDEVGWLITAFKKHQDPALKWMTTFDQNIPDMARKKPDFVHMYGHLTNSYAKWFNARYQRSGQLFEERFKRKLIRSQRHLGQLILYINRNPQKHLVTSSFEAYPWISYHQLINDRPGWLKKEIITDLFGDRKSFIAALHKKDINDCILEEE